MEQREFEMLAKAEAVTDAYIAKSTFETESPYSLIVWIRNEKEPKTVQTARGDRREWANLERLHDWIRRLGYDGEIRLGRFSETTDTNTPKDA